MGNKCFWYMDLHSSAKKNAGTILLRAFPILMVVVGIGLIPFLTRNNNIYGKLIPFFIMAFGFMGLLLILAINPVGRKRYIMVLDEEKHLWVADVFQSYFLRPFALEGYQPFMNPVSNRYAAIVHFISDMVRYKKLQKEILGRDIPAKVKERPEMALQKITDIPSIIKGDHYFRFAYQTEQGRKGYACIYNDMEDYEDLLELCDNYNAGIEIRKDNHHKQIGILLLALGALVFVGSFVVSIELKILALNLIMFFGSMLIIGIGVGFIKQ